MITLFVASPLPYLFVQVLARLGYFPVTILGFDTTTVLDCIVLLITASVWLVHVIRLRLTFFIYLGNYWMTVFASVSSIMLMACLLGLTCGWDVLRSVLICVQCGQFCVPPFSRSNPAYSKAEREKIMKCPEVSLFELLQQGYFLCKLVPIGEDPHFTIGYSNKKGKEMLSTLGLTFTEFCTKLTEIEPPHRTLRDIIEKVLTDENVLSGACTKTWLRPTSKNNTQAGSVSESPFSNFRGRIVKLNKHNVMVVISEQNVASSLFLTEKLVSTVLCTLSHELRTLLNGIVGNLELLSGGVSKKGQYRVCYQIATGSSHSLANKLNDLFDYLQLQNKEFKLHYGEVILDEALQEIDYCCKWLAKQRQISLSIRKVRPLPRTIIGDKARIVQIILNMLIKAIEYTDYAGRVELLVKRANRWKIKFKVRSYGQGMYHKLRQHIKAMEQRQKESKKVKKGVTENLEVLNLQICQLICKEMGTNLVVKTVADKYVQLGFEVRDGFPSTKENSPEKDRRYSHALDKTPKGEMNEGGLSARGEISKALFSKTLYNVPSLSTAGGSNDIIPPQSKPSVLRVSADDMSSPEREIPSELPYMKRVSLPTSPSKHHLPLGEWSKLSKTSSSGSFLLRRVPPAHPETVPKKSPPLAHASNSSPRKKQRRTTMATPCTAYAVRPNGCVDDVDMCRAIIADDNTLNRYVLKSLLKRHKLNSIEAGDGKEAVQLIQRYIKTNTLYELTLIFMDLQMPVMNGIEAVVTIRKMCEEARLSVPTIIGVSSDPLEEDRKRFIQAGLTEFISKPITEQKIGGVLAKYWKKYKVKQRKQVYILSIDIQVKVQQHSPCTQHMHYRNNKLGLNAKFLWS
eukprot:TRINITY_DN478_c0_g1_i1.p2 TRINITY_DN478_c0_g1~~TRINITY_DN478_c0_g1_i1.p2  ORF type:complete len:855 (+),score=53.40 TRINITY_DN478_c0_g1_i1:8612-11176(+)